ncbi:FAD-dependent oxidoreductase [Pseudonocardia endophytica]|uniref:FAD dependent oxidoreductase n=1 Tax=Pseudonocardia endophytica TaxID=401976 RepID=A0A4V2PHK6_PSEEN|nr:FAD-dependent oxidoreductase [Pseudonocardia endophytica]TCK21106.1 FAD dependent oxidoreductase [Pseudonocardia endophytica]
MHLPHAMGAGQETVVLPAESVPVSRTVDVAVAGGGPAGFCAAVAAARAGARTVLVEKAPFLGGTATGAMVASFMGFYWRDRLVGGGIGHEITERLVAAGGATGFTPYVLAEASENPVAVRTFPFDPEVLKFVLDEMASESGVEVALHTQAVDPLVHGTTVLGLVTQDLYSRTAVRARVVVDATADAVLCRRAGCATENQVERRRDRQPMTMMARLSNVDVPGFRALPRVEKRRLALEGMQSGALNQQLLSLVGSPAGTDAFILMTRVSGLDGSDSRDLTAAERRGREQVRGVVEFLRQSVPGFEGCHLAAVAPWIGVRETWRIRGEFLLSEDDVLQGRQFDDAVAQGGGPLDVHDTTGSGLLLVEPPAPFSIPYRCLVPRGFDGVLVAGRCLSATGRAMGATRHMGTAMATGQAAGTAAAIAVAESVEPRDVPTDRLRTALREAGAVVDSPLLGSTA